MEEDIFWNQDDHGSDVEDPIPKPEVRALRRSTRTKRKPELYQDMYQNHGYMSVAIPRSHDKAVQSAHADSWKEEEQAELESHRARGTWTLGARPPGVNVIASKWIYTIKTDENGNLKSFKARLCAKGFSQRHGEDFFDTFAPVISNAGFGIVFAVAAHYGLEVHHLDVKTAFSMPSHPTKFICVNQRDISSEKMDKNSYAT